MARRYQGGCLKLETQKSGEQVWLGRYREDVTLPNGRIHRVRRKIRLGSKQDLRSERLAWRAFQPYLDMANVSCIATQQIYPTSNPVSAHIPHPKSLVSFGTFVEKWEKEVAIHMKFSARETAKCHINKWLDPAFSKTALGDVRAETVQIFSIP